MSFKTIRDYFVVRLVKLGFSEANELNFGSDIAMKDKFILRSPTLQDERPTLVDRLHPQREIEIRFALKLSDSKTQNIEYQNFVLRIEQFIREVTNPTNFQASSFSLRNLTFSRLEETDNQDYIEFRAIFIVEDELLYA